MRVGMTPSSCAAAGSDPGDERQAEPCGTAEDAAPAGHHLMFFETTAAISSAAWMTLEFIS